MTDDRTACPETPYTGRRGFLAAGSAAAALLAGCTDSGPGGGGDSNEVDPSEATENADDDAETNESDDEDEGNATDSDAEGDNDSEAESDTDSVEDESDDEEGGEEDSSLEHESAENMAHSPVLGPEALDEGATIIMFDDPSCPACAYFEAEIFPDLESHIDAGELSVVWRGIPVIEDWSDAALQTLWATYERDVDTFWEVRDHVLESQESIDSGEEATETATSYLESESDLDADGIRAEAENGDYAGRLERDGQAATSAGLDATPYFYLFRDGEFRTEVQGAQDYRVFENALEL